MASNDIVGFSALLTTIHIALEKIPLLKNIRISDTKPNKSQFLCVNSKTLNETFQSLKAFFVFITSPKFIQFQVRVCAGEKTNNHSNFSHKI